MEDRQDMNIAEQVKHWFLHTLLPAVKLQYIYINKYSDSLPLLRIPGIEDPSA